MPDHPAAPSPIPRGEARGRILEAAAAVIAERGIRRMRVEDVARAAGISNGLLYYHFGDRSGLVRAALERANARAPSTLGPVVPAGAEGVRERLVAALVAELDEAPSVRADSVVWNEVSASAVFDPELREALGRVTEDWNAAVARAVEAAVADGSATAPAGVAAAAEYLTTMVEGLSLRWLAGSLPLDRAHAHLRAAVDHVLPRAGAEAASAP